MLDLTFLVSFPQSVPVKHCPLPIASGAHPHFLDTVDVRIVRSQKLTEFILVVLNSSSETIDIMRCDDEWAATR